MFPGSEPEVTGSGPQRRDAAKELDCRPQGAPGVEWVLQVRDYLSPASSVTVPSLPLSPERTPLGEARHSLISLVLFYGTKPFLLVVHACWGGRIRKAFHIILFVFSLNDVIDME